MQIHYIVIWICNAIWFSICNIHRCHTYLYNFALKIAFVNMSINMFLFDFYVDRITFRIHHSIDDNEFWNVLIDICVNFIAIFIRFWKCKRLKQFCVLLLNLFLMNIFKIRWIFFWLFIFRQNIHDNVSSIHQIIIKFFDLRIMNIVVNVFWNNNHKCQWCRMTNA